MTDPIERFDALLEAMATKPPLTVENADPALDDDDKREGDES